MGGSTALKLAFEIPDSIDKIILLSPAGLFGEPKSIPFLLTKLAPHFLDCLRSEKVFVGKHLLSQMNVLVNGRANCFNSLGCKGWRNSLASFAKSGGFAGTQKYIKISQLKHYVEKMIEFLEKKRLKI